MTLIYFCIGLVISAVTIVLYHLLDQLINDNEVEMFSWSTPRRSFKGVTPLHFIFLLLGMAAWPFAAIAWPVMFIIFCIESKDFKRFMVKPVCNCLSNQPEKE